jgi:hypothetical protein
MNQLFPIIRRKRRSLQTATMPETPLVVVPQTPPVHPAKKSKPDHAKSVSNRATP